MKYAVCLISAILAGCSSIPPAGVVVLGSPCVFPPFVGKSNSDLAAYTVSLRDIIRGCEADRRANEYK